MKLIRRASEHLLPWLLYAAFALWLLMHGV